MLYRLRSTAFIAQLRILGKMLRREEHPNLILIERFLKNKSGLTSYDLSKLLGINVRNVRPYLTILHNRKKIYIADWKTPRLKRGPKIPVWGLNEFEEIDEPYPERIDPKITQQNTRKRNAIKSTTARLATGAALRG